MRRLIWILVILSILWCAWWAVLGFGVKSGIKAWFQDRRDLGWQAEYSRLDLQGFPVKVQADVKDIALTDPATDLTITLPLLTISAPAYWLGDITVDLPDDTITITTPEREMQINVQNGRADLHLHPGTTLELEQLLFVSDLWSSTTPAGTLYSGDDLTLSVKQSTDTPSRYNVLAQTNGFSPGNVARAKLQLPDSWPQTFKQLALDGSVTFSQPWDLASLKDQHPQPHHIKVNRAEIAWSDLRIFLAADLVVNTEGVPDGTVNIRADNWQSALDLAQDAGLLTPAIYDQAQQVLAQLAQLSGDKDALDVQLNFKAGFMAVGIIPIGPAPRLILP